MNPTKIMFLGTSSALPDAGGDTVSFLINDRYLVDTGWAAVGNMRKLEVDPAQIEYLLFTHLHHDHYLSLPSLLFYFLSVRKPLKDLKIIGPADDVERVVKLAMNFLQTDNFYPDCSFPTVIPLTPGDSYEDENFNVATSSTKHPVQGLCYRFKDKQTGKFFSFTGDTAYHPPIIDLIKGSPLLIHEASMGPIAANPSDNAYLHSGAIDAAEIAKAADVGKLLLVHGSKSISEASVEAARKIFLKPVEWPKDGQAYIL
ncbi:MBL fold metallo-hydrolase [Paenibacillus solisilvae]|uniref:MBL fold metallo-hydrolase n=1 Tax=Paenibacillus solisilvae TaxID=2486751 RepID=A0ABW0VUY9_9BACL